MAAKRRVSVTPDRNLLPRKSLVTPYQQQKMLIHFGNDLILFKADTFACRTRQKKQCIAVGHPSYVHAFCKLHILQDAPDVTACNIRICVHLTVYQK